MAISNMMIIKMSINVFLHNYQSLTSIAALLVLPASASVLASQALLPSSAVVLEAISSRLRSLFQAAHFPAACKFFSILNFKLTQTIFSFLFTLPVAITFLLLAKAAIVHVINDSSGRRRRRLGFPPLQSFLPLYPALLTTHWLNCVIVLSANSTIFALFFVIFNAVDFLGLSSRASELVLSAAGAVLYSVVVANATVICNLSIVASAMDNRGGCLPVLKACLAVGGRVVAALGLALPANMGMAAVEALFQYRVVKQYNATEALSAPLLWEALTIAYFHALLVVLEVIMSCTFYNKCRMDCRAVWEIAGDHQEELEPEDKGPHQV